MVASLPCRGKTCPQCRSAASAWGPTFTPLMDGTPCSAKCATLQSQGGGSCTQGQLVPAVPRADAEPARLQARPAPRPPALRPVRRHPALRGAGAASPAAHRHSNKLPAAEQPRRLARRLRPRVKPSSACTQPTPSFKHLRAGVRAERGGCARRDAQGRGAARGGRGAAQRGAARGAAGRAAADGRAAAAAQPGRRAAAAAHARRRWPHVARRGARGAGAGGRAAARVGVPGRGRRRARAAAVRGRRAAAARGPGAAPGLGRWGAPGTVLGVSRAALQRGVAGPAECMQRRACLLAAPLGPAGAPCRPARAGRVRAR